MKKSDLSFEEYYKNLPRKPMGSGVLFFDSSDNLLLVKPNYKEGWVVPGGTVDEGESPKNAAKREVQEEIGLVKEIGSLLCLDFQSPEDNLQFIFYGGTLSASEIQNIVLQKSELTEFKFVYVEEAINKYLRPKLARRLPSCIDAHKENIFYYLENGKKVF